MVYSLTQHEINPFDPLPKFNVGTSVYTTNINNKTPLIYPNPAQYEFTINKPTENTAKMAVVDILGRTIYTETLVQANTIIVTKNWQNGVYFVVIEEQGSKFVQKISVLR